MALTVRASHAANKAYLEFLGIHSYRPNEGLTGVASAEPVVIAGGGLVPATSICGVGINLNVVRAGKPHVLTMYFNSPQVQTINVLGQALSKLGTLPARVGTQAATFAFVPPKAGWDMVAFVFPKKFDFYKAEIDVVQ